MNRNLDIALIRTFVAVADHASMTTAANLLFMTQGAFSQQVKRLEESLGSVRKVPARRSCCVKNRLGMLIYNQ